MIDQTAPDFIKSQWLNISYLLASEGLIHGTLKLNNMSVMPQLVLHPDSNVKHRVRD